MSATYRVNFTTTISVSVRIKAADEEEAAELAHGRAEEFLATVTGDLRTNVAEASLDGQGEDSVEVDDA